ncbi:MAG: tetratricopeptide repeat protein [Chloroherpetonaceae bacterium]|nr:tetratricopeptide repeat protein [Chthonomonadaceae bacterium]MDW8206342.1 tetratricopeptide repeat protein [Chloroherpetonaceae bacterium]
MFSRVPRPSTTSEPGSLPVPRASLSPPGRNLIVVLCLIALFAILGWSLLSNATTRRTPPELQRGMAALSRGQIAEAQQFFESALKQRPADPAIYLTILIACQRYRQWNLLVLYGERAITDCRYARDAVRAELYRRVTFGYLEQATPGSQNGFLRLALLYARRAWELDRQNPDMINHYAYLLADHGSSLEAHLMAEGLLATALRLVRADSHNPENRFLLPLIEDSYGWVLCRLGRSAEAITYLQDALNHLSASHETDDAEARKEIYYHLGVAYHQNGRPEEARRMLDIALYYDPNYRRAREAREALALPPASVPYVILPGVHYNPEALFLNSTLTPEKPLPEEKPR